MNAIASQVVDSRRGMHSERVFTYRDNPLAKLHNSLWKRAWEKADLPTERGNLKRVHNLRRTLGRRLHSAGIALETRKALLGHSNGDITTHYSAADLNELIHAAESIVTRGKSETPNLMLIGMKAKETVGNLSEKEKGLAIISR